MRNVQRLVTSAAFAAAAALGFNASTQAVELLTNGNLESSVSPPNWVLTQSITELPGTGVSAVEQISFANNPPATPMGLGLFIKPASGNQGPFADQNHKIDITLTQTVNATAGRTYTLKGDAQLADGYSGSVEFMDSLSPSDPLGTGTVPSPTETLFELAFLNAGLEVIGTPTVLDLRENLEVNVYQTRTLPGVVAPVGATKVRVSAIVTDALQNIGFQDVYFDNFVLNDSFQPATNRLQNGNLNTVGPPNGYEITELPDGTDSLSFIGFANHTTGGAQGMWLRAFTGTEAEPADAIISQTVPGVAGGNYTFSAWSLFEVGYSGDAEIFPGTQTDTLLELAFLDGGGAVIGAPNVLDLNLGPDGLPDGPAGGGGNPRDGQHNDTTWREFSVSGTAPAGTASVRITASGIDMFDSGTNPQSAFFDDFSLDGPAATTDVDLDDDGDVDGNDFLLIQQGVGTTTNDTHFAAWRTEFGPAQVAAVGAVPEPATAMGAMILALCGAGVMRRRGA
jgi:hypothetical protein